MESHLRTTAFASGQAGSGGCSPLSLLCALVLVFAATQSQAETTIYVGKHFEVRDHDQPTKYVFNGSTRVARIIGSLSTNIRIQRFRLHPGWNLLSLAVSATNLSDQLKSPGVVASAHSWNAQTGSYFPVPQVASSGMVLWVNATTNATLSVVGAYSDPVNREVSAGATYLSGTGLEAWTPNFPATLSAWHFSPQPGDSALAPFSSWRSRLTGDLSDVNDLPHAFPPGQALYVINPAPFELEIPDPALRVRYYHQDHLGSSSAMTDAGGALVEETAFYPFGIQRHEHRVRQIEESYTFTQKERDRESGFNYFEARYLDGGLSRFLSVDPKYAQIGGGLPDPQELNLYAYVGSNPLRYADPTGLDEEDAGGGIIEFFQETTEVALGGFVEATEVNVAGAPSFFLGMSDAMGAGGPAASVAKKGLVASGIANTDGPHYGAGFIGGLVLGLGMPGGAAARGTKTAVEGGASALALAKTEVDALAKTAAASGARPAAASIAKPAALDAATAGSRSGAARVASAAGAASKAEHEAYFAIFREQQAALKGMQTISLNESLATKLAFEQANAIFKATYGRKYSGAIR